MMKKNVLWALLAAFVLQALALASVIWGHYQAHSKGKVFLFQTEPIDPRDYFRGQYVALKFAAEDGSQSGEEQSGVANDICQDKNYQQLSGKFYAQIGQDDKGLAAVRFVSRQKPDNDDYVRINQVYCSGKRLYFSLPFNRYYANENEAIPIETAARKSPEETFLQVAIYRGRYAVQQLILPIAAKK